MKILAIESSCDETGAAIVVNDNEVLGEALFSQIDIHEKFGGVVPEIASRHHVLKILAVIDEALKKANMEVKDVDIIAVTAYPGLLGSLIVGNIAAETLSFVYNKPLIPVDHLLGHVFVNNLEEKLEYPFLTLIVSGGHTELMLVRSPSDTEVIGTTLDDAAGEAFDKVAKVLGLGYPGGPKIEKKALEGKPIYKFPKPLIKDNSYNFSFSGLKTAVLNLVNEKKMRDETIDVENIAASFQKTLIETLLEKTVKLAKEEKVKQVVLSGGVAANKTLREEFRKVITEDVKVKFSYPSLKYCTDNAVMIGIAGYYKYLSTLERK